MGWNRAMPYGELSDDPDVWDVLAAWGRGLRRGRLARALTQEMLEHRSGVDQSAISRFELARAPRMPAERLARLGLVLGHWFPLGTCPHEHDCAWRVLPRAAGQVTSREEFYRWRQAANASPPLPWIGTPATRGLGPAAEHDPARYAALEAMIFGLDGSGDDDMQ